MSEDRDDVVEALAKATIGLHEGCIQIASADGAGLRTIYTHLASLSEAQPEEGLVDDAWRAWLETMRSMIDEDWAADRQEGGNAPKPRNIPDEILTALSRNHDEALEFKERIQNTTREARGGPQFPEVHRARIVRESQWAEGPTREIANARLRALKGDSKSTQPKGTFHVQV